jgi:hypothetical protein
MLTYKASLPLQALAILTFGLYLAVGLELALQLSALLSISLSFGLTVSVFLSLQLVLSLIVQFNIALGLSLPELVINLQLALEFELSIVLGLIAQINVIIEACASASLVAYAYVGSGAALGPQVQGAIQSGWPDGTPPGNNVTAYLFVATATGPYTVDQVASASLVPPPSTPPTPPPPSPPPGSYPPPQGYEWGLASVSFPSQVYPTMQYPADQARGTLTIDHSVATGIGAVTGVTMTHNGSGYPGPAMAVISDTVNAVSIAGGSPVVVTLPNALTIPVGNGLGVTIAGVTGTPSINGQANAKVLTSTTVALYADSAFTVPISGAGPYTGGTVTGGGTGAVVSVSMGGGAQTALKAFFSGLLWPRGIGPALVGGKVGFQIMLGTTFSLLLELLSNLKSRASLLAAASASASIAFIPPSISLSLELLAKIAATLRANLGAKIAVYAGAAISAQIAIVLSLWAQIAFFLGIGNVDLEIWEYQGPGNGLAAAIAQGPGQNGWHDGTAPGTVVAAGVFGLTNQASAAAFATFFGGV